MDYVIYFRFAIAQMVIGAACILVQMALCASYHSDDWFRSVGSLFDGYIIPGIWCGLWVSSYLYLSIYIYMYMYDYICGPVLI